MKNKGTHLPESPKAHSTGEFAILVAAHCFVWSRGLRQLSVSEACQMAFFGGVCHFDVIPA